jgi:phosphoglycerate kinase
MSGSAIGKKTVRDIDVAGKRVLLRADLNVPLADGGVADDSRIVASLPTIRFLLERGCSVVVCSHLGRPKGPDPALSLRPVAVRLQELLGAPVEFAGDCSDAATMEAVAGLEPGRVAMIENLRFHPEEEANDEGFAKSLARFGEIYVNDAFGAAHRAHASTEGVARFLPAVAGLLLENEVRYLGSLVADPPRPFAAIIGGAKVSSKMAAVKHLLPRVDMMAIGGGMANTFLKAQGHEVGRSLVEDGLVPTAAGIIEKARELGRQLLLPSDVVVADAINAPQSARVVDVDSVESGAMIVDIGPRTVEAYLEALRGCRAIVWNGPMGIFETPAFARGSFALARGVAALEATTVVGGGETAQLVNDAGVAGSITHVSTGGGASLEMLEGKPLPGVEALMDADN